MFIKAYAKDYHAEDRATWQAISTQKPQNGASAFGSGFESSRFSQELLKPNGFTFLASAPLQSPVLDGYAGAIHLYRTTEQGDFNAADLSTLADIARELDDILNKNRENRLVSECEPNHPLIHRPASRQFIFDRNQKQILPTSNLNALDERLQQQIKQLAGNRLGHVNGEAVTSDRTPLPDADGDLWVFRAVTRKHYPALGDGPFVFFCQQPDCCEWSLVRPQDFAADPELSRLIPALEFMKKEFRRGPTLNEIAKTAHLSPFHFHRRFTELLGLTPKHFLLECQIDEAKRLLVGREKELTEIASICGFAHQSHFTSRFKQATGLTPTRWRRLALRGREPQTANV
ncbi:MAG TPA: AraC family transcriptional regulator [Tepidisphaeraceae bacterium]|nr:AraC family transcriptional regulator [Tepidisphaeraceae bacterium]